MEMEIQSDFPVAGKMFVYASPLGTITWEPSPEMVRELRVLALKANGAPTQEERASSVLAMEVLYQAATSLYLEVLALSMFGLKDGETGVWAFALVAKLQEYKNELTGVESPEIARVLTKHAIHKNCS